MDPMLLTEFPWAKGFGASSAPQCGSPRGPEQDPYPACSSSKFIFCSLPFLSLFWHGAMPRPSWVGGTGAGMGWEISVGSCFCHGHGLGWQELLRAEHHPSPQPLIPIFLQPLAPRSGSWGSGIGLSPHLLQLPGCAVHHLQLLSASERGNKQLSGDE